MKQCMRNDSFWHTMKNILVVACSAAILVSCNPLGLESVDKVEEDLFWENPKLARSYIDRFYLFEPKSASHFFTSEQWSDNAIGNDNPDNVDFRQRTFVQRDYEPLNPSGGPWDDQYKEIRAVNVGIERIPAVPALSESQANQMLAECYFFRAWLYFEMEQYWGAVPIVDRVLGVMDDTMIPRSSREELFDFILTDLDKSISFFKASEAAPELGKINIHAVELVKSRVALYAACAADASQSGLYDKLSGDEKAKALFRFTKDAGHYYQIAFQAAGNVIGKYSLDKSYANLFNTDAGHISREAIWPVMFDDKKRDTFNPTKFNGPKGNYYERGGTEDWGVMGSAFPTQDLVDCYYQKDVADGKWKKWWETTQVRQKMNGTVDAETGMFKGSGENYRIMFENRDSRFYATVLYDSCFYAGNIVRTWIDNTPNKEKFSALHTGFVNTTKLDVPTGRGASSMTITGYYPRKFLLGTTDSNGKLNTTVQPKTCYFMLRYAEVLLNYAEAAIKLNKQAEALDAINQIRNRAGMDNFDAKITGHDLWEEYKTQRRVEFAYEVPGQRYFDLLRWSESTGKSTIEEINRGPKAILIFRKGVEIDKAGQKGYPVLPGEETYFVPQIETRRFTYDIHLKKFDDAKYYFLPFSQALMESYRGFVQNPGW